MKKKKRKQIIDSIFSLIGILAFAFLGFSLFAVIYTYIYENPFLYLGISLGVLILLVIIGKVTIKKIKRKVVDIFT